MSRHKLTVRDLEDSWACQHARGELTSDERVAEIRALLDEVRADAWDEGVMKVYAMRSVVPDPIRSFNNPYREQEEA